MKATTVKFPLRGPASACPLHIFLHFTTGQLEKITLEKGEELALFFVGNYSAQAAVVQWFEAFFQGRVLPFPLFLPQGKIPPFSWRILHELQKIPRGETMSYADVAASVGNGKSARAVGNICRANPFPLVIPCHRVIKRDGTLGGFAYGPELKQFLLNMERLEPL